MNYLEFFTFFQLTLDFVLGKLPLIAEKKNNLARHCDVDLGYQHFQPQHQPPSFDFNRFVGIHVCIDFRGCICCCHSCCWEFQSVFPAIGFGPFFIETIPWHDLWWNSLEIRFYDFWLFNFCNCGFFEKMKKKTYRLE